MNKIEEILIKETQYKGNNEPNVKQISASDFGSDLLQIYLRYKHGVPQNNKFTQSTLGSLVHKGIEEILKQYKDFETEKDVIVKFSNGWSLSGSIDIVDNTDKVIYDVKVTKQYTVESLKKEPKHHYIQQLSVYRYLIKELTGVDYKVKLIAILKDGTDFDFRNGGSKPHIKVIDLEPMSYEEVENKFNEIVSKLEQYDKLGEYPEQCNELWIRKFKGKPLRTKCEIYCAYKDVCPYFKQFKKMTDIKF